MPNILTTDFLSLFNDPPEDPLSEGGHWADPFPSDVGTGTTLLPMRKTGGVATDESHPAALGGYIAYAYWTQEMWAGDHVEVWGIAGGGQLGAAVETWRLFMFSNLTPPTGYLAYYGGGLGKGYQIRAYNTTYVPTDIYGGSGPYPGYMVLRLNGDQIELWSTDWTDLDPNNLTLRASGTTTAYRGPFWIGMGIEDPTGGGLYWQTFGGGTKNRTQIYRILRG